MDTWIQQRTSRIQDVVSVSSWITAVSRAASKHLTLEILQTDHNSPAVALENLQDICFVMYKASNYNI